MSKDEIEKIWKQLESGENPTSQPSSDDSGLKTSERGYNNKSEENGQGFRFVNEGVDGKNIIRKK